MSVKILFEWQIVASHDYQLRVSSELNRHGVSCEFILYQQQCNNDIVVCRVGAAETQALIYDIICVTKVLEVGNIVCDVIVAYLELQVMKEINSPAP